MNVDGSHLGSSCLAGIGGIIGDSSGRVSFVFAHHIGVATSLKSNAHTFLQGLQLCHSHSLHGVSIEVNSLIVANMVHGFSKIDFINRHIISMLQNSIGTLLTFPEKLIQLRTPLLN
ncbi:hypothetical protein ACH5RR_009250 [Cinchona calisaya]|uniref:RNase H type-1 domain-containing protein n=1 Tax=Cinchona calisaya TaxID=153742 RepID=A0ABD3AFL3_9GENT